MSLWIVVGGQYGSEGKGKVSAFITKQENIDICVRCGGPNSGHSFVDDNGRNVVVRQLPTGFINPRTRLLIPAGALIDPSIVKHEIESLGLTPERVGIDQKCFIIEEKDRELEQRLHLRERLSSTLCGVGAAQARRVLRSEDAKLARDAGSEHPWLKRYLTDVSDEVNTALDLEKKVLIEGTQGFGLSLYHSAYYPYATSRDTTASGFLSEVGVSPRLVTEIVVVFRTFPIRVAGMQAGPLKQETTWEQIQKESNYPRPVEEHTSVTHKLRRVARFDWDLAKRALVMNRATRVAINGLDLLNYRNFAVTKSQSLDRSSMELTRKVAEVSGCDLLYLGTGPSLRHLFMENPSMNEDSVCYSGMQHGSGR
jgi:adenylosuccinate synthase